MAVVEICDLIEADLGVEIPLDDVWDAPTVADFIAVVERCLETKTEPT